MRDAKLDALRCLALAMVVLAHVEPPRLVFQARLFDVPLLVIVSALSFSASCSEGPYFAYIWKRVRRLVFPVWLFLSLYFLLILASGWPIPLPANRTILSSFLLVEGIGYVWIIRVFLLVALVAPAIVAQQGRRSRTLAALVLPISLPSSACVFPGRAAWRPRRQFSPRGAPIPFALGLSVRRAAFISSFSLQNFRFCRRTPSHRQYFLVLTLVLLAYHLALAAHRCYLDGVAACAVQETALCLVAYAVVFAVGLRLPMLSRRETIAVAIVTCAVVAGLAGGFWLKRCRLLLLHDFKYPPRLYYISYGVFVSTMAWLGAERLVVALTRLRVLPAVEFVGRNSIWTYLWHIPLVEIVPPFCAAIRYPLVLLGAMSITAIQAYVVGRVFAPWIHRPAVRRHMVALLTG